MKLVDELRKVRDILYEGNTPKDAGDPVVLRDRIERARSALPSPDEIASIERVIKSLAYPRDPGTLVGEYEKTFQRLSKALDIVCFEGCSTWVHPETCATQTHGPFKWCDTCKLLKEIDEEKT